MDTIDVRSPQGHAAFSMQGIDDRWIMIQQNTFKNWANDQLQQLDHKVEDLQTDFGDGIKLCALMEILQGRRVGRVVKKPINQHQYLENCNLALRAMARDGIKLVNIGAEDIINGNIRLIMGLVWRMILKYQISQSKVPPKKLMLSWINAIMPNMDISNFSHHWNDGVALHGLIEYCRPGTCPNWRQLSRRDGLANCQHAMELAKDLFDIPMVVSPENLANPDLDELSGMTYMSYFMKMDSPGYQATLRFVNKQIPDRNIKNFQTDWNDGIALSHLVLSLGGTVEGWPNVNRNDWTALAQLAMAGGRDLGVEPVISAKEMSDPEVDHLGVMAYAAWFEHLRPRQPVRVPTPPPVVVAAARPPTPPPPPVVRNPAELLALNAPDRDTIMGNTVQFTLECLGDDVDRDKVRVEIQGPNSTPAVQVNWDSQYGYGEFVPIEPGPHRIVVYNEGEVVQGAPCDLEVGVDASSITLATQVSSCPLGMVTPFVLNAADVRRGAVKVEARSPTGRIQDMGVIETNGVYTANFTPTEVGDWNISIMYDGIHIQGSPFSVRVYDAAQVKVFGLEGGSVGRMFSFSVDTSSAGEGELTVNIMHNGRSVPVQIYPEGRGMYRVTFTPDGAGIYSIKVNFAGMEVQGSPYTLEIVDSSMVTASGEGLSSIEINRRSTFVVNTGQKGSTGDIRVTITGPRGNQVPCDVLNNGDGTYTIQYSANDVGEYTIDVFYYGKPIQGSPFRVHAYDWNRISVRNLPNTSMVGKLCEFDIDAQNAGSGNLEIMINDGLIPCSVQNRGNRQFHASFMPKEPTPHYVQIRFNGKEVNGSPWTVDVKTSARVSAAGQGLHLVPVHKPATFEVRTGLTIDYGAVQANITSPSDRTVSTRVMNNHNGTYTIEYTPTEVGTYTINVAYDGVTIPESPFQSKAYDSGAIVVSQMPNGIVGNNVQFTIDVTQAGEGQLEIMVNRGEVPNTVKMMSKGVFLVSFIPMDTRPHYVDIKFNGELLPRCPLTVPILDASRVTVQGDGLHQVAVNRQSQFRVTTQSAGEADLRVRVTAPSGKNVPARIRGNHTKGFDVQVSPDEVGNHKVDIEYAKQSIPGSPFFMQVYDHNRVLVEGVSDGIVGKRSTFVVDVQNAGEGSLEISVANGSQNIQNHVRQLVQGRFEVGYTPMEGGMHSTSVTFNGEHVEGSPFPFLVTDASKLSASGDGLGLVPCNKPTTFNIRSSGIEKLQHLKVRIIGPSGQEVLPRIHDNGDSNITVDWTPRETGEYQVSVQYQGRHIQGSPYTVKVWDHNNVVVSNISRGRLGKPTYFNIDASRAGSGSLEIIVSSAGENVPNFVKSDGNACFEVSYTPQVHDSHTINVRFNGEHVPGSPFLVEMEGGAHSVAVDSGLIRVPVDRSAAVSIDPRRMGHLLEEAVVDVVSPSDKVMRARVYPIPGHNKFKAEFIPREVGPHCLQASIGDWEITGSPFGCEVYDLHSIIVSKLNRGVVGKPYDFEVDTTRAGAGELDVYIKAANRRVPLKLIEKVSGVYRGYFMPKEPQRHLVFITFTKEPIPGSPFVLDIEDSTLVVARGRCLEATPINKKATFEIDPSKAPFKAEAMVKILSPPPEKQSIHYTKSGNYIDGWSVGWVPKHLGVHTIDVQYGDSHVVGSPFKCKVYDLSKVIIIRDDSMQGVDVDGIPGEDIVFYVDASEAGAGNLEIIVRCAKDGTRIPNYLEAADRSGKFRIYFTPKENCYRYKVDVAFNDEQIHGSPFFCNLVDGTNVSAVGEGLKLVPANHPAYFNVKTSGVGEAGLDVDITTPSGKSLPCRVTGSALSGYHVEYTPRNVGRHSVHIQYADTDIQGSPFHPEVYDPSLVHVTGSQQGVVGHPINFEVDTSDAGKGQLEVEVQGLYSKPKVRITPKGHDLHEVTFEPKEAGIHRVSVTFNKEEINGSPFKCTVYDLSKLEFNLDNLQNVPANNKVVLNLHTRGAPLEEMEATVTNPYNREVPVNIVHQGGRFIFEFVPKEVGKHVLSVQYNGMDLVDSPHVFTVYDPRKVKVQQVSRKALVNKEASIVVDTSDAGPGKLQVNIKSRGQQVAFKHHQLDNFKHKFMFYPSHDFDHVIEVVFNGDAVPGSPITLPIMDPLKRMSISRSSMRLSAVNRDTWSLIETQGAAINQDLVVVHITAPNGEQVPAKIVHQPDGDFKVEYSSKYTGRHTVEILYAGQAIMGSPFYVEIYDPNKIRVEGERKGVVGQRIEFDIIRNEAGKAELGLSITSPSGRTIPYDLAPTALGDRVTYMPTEVGPHNIYITYGGLEVPGCPITQNVVDTGSGIVVSGNGLYKAAQNAPSEFRVDAKGHSGDLYCQVDGPNSIARCQVLAEGMGRYLVRYTPVEVGRFNITLKWNGRELSGSPYHPEVVNPGGVQVVGGWSSMLDSNNQMILQINQTKRLEFDTSMAGPGQLTAEVQGPGGVVPTFIDNQGGRWVLTFTPTMEGDHYINIFWTGMPIPNSPFHGVVRALRQVNHEKVVLTGRGLLEAKVREEAEFVIDGTEAGAGQPDVSLTGVKADIDVRCTSIGGNKYRCTYTPKLPGAYLLNIMWSDRQVRGSPFKVNVTASSDASKVMATGEGLKLGVMGREIKATIDTRRAGPGELTAHCMGPSKAAVCELFDHHDGTFTLSVKPAEPGRHVLNIQFGGEHVPGSPFVLKIAGAPDASKVYVKGPGVEHGILATYQSKFICETKGAGAGQLTVRIRGPKGAFRVEMQRQSQKDRTILCRYEPREVGDYIISVKWSGEHVPGSPFRVQIFDTSSELERFLRDNPERRQNAPQLTNGWEEDF